MTEAIIHWISGGMFALGVAAWVYGRMATREANTATREANATLEEASALYRKTSQEAQARTRAMLQPSKEEP